MFPTELAYSMLMLAIILVSILKVHTTPLNANFGHFAGLYADGINPLARLARRSGSVTFTCLAWPVLVLIRKIQAFRHPDSGKFFLIPLCFTSSSQVKQVVAH